MKTICITIVVVAVLVLLILLAYVWLKLRGWNITFDACVKTDAEEPIKRLPARDAKGRFIKQQ
ncbi:hypothetical protein [Alistipes timonensis]|jgi:hypothetical protein|uniref:hypothetical protein n=1 Tax=Alistipes timonensis TaxID=1465754 RepID=UPI00205EB70B|nr:hypothetical protein [Alistipes timonensis]DAO68746.1 MAG TPA: Cell-membrane associated Mucin15 [Caudoviricetes sp.]